MNHNFIKCGLIGWTMELFFSSMQSLTLHNDLRLIGNTSLLMFPIYGLGAIFCPLYRILSKLNITLRGIIYTILIFATEYSTGWILRQFSMCPWDYSGSKYNINGLIRLDFAPVWFILGLVFERTTCRCGTSRKPCDK